MSFSEERHNLSGKFCPHCLRELVEVKTSGFLFCPDSATCEFELMPGEPGWLTVGAARHSKKARAERALVKAIQEASEQLNPEEVRDLLLAEAAKMA